MCEVQIVDTSGRFEVRLSGYQNVVVATEVFTEFSYAQNYAEELSKCTGWKIQQYQETTVTEKRLTKL